MLSCAYLASPESCEEWRAVSDSKRVVVVNGSSVEEMDAVATTSDNSAVKSFLKVGVRCVGAPHRAHDGDTIEPD